MKVLVTGGLGYIGSHTVVELLKRDHEVVIVDNLYNSEIEVLEKIEKITGKKPKFYKVDIVDIPAMEEVFEQNEIDAVIHFAGLKAVGESVEEPLKYYHNNVTGTINLCQVMKKFNCKNIVFSSSACVYGANNPIPYKEDMACSATNPYGTTKIMIEDILRDLSVSDPKWRVMLLRYFNPIGAHESGLIGENPVGIPNNLLPYIMRVAAGKLECVNVFGDDYDTTDGTGVRDYIHVMDLAEGHISALDYMMKHEGVEAINLGTGKGHSVLEVIHAFEKVNHVKVNYKITERRKGDLGEYYANADKAKTLLGWHAKRDLEQMCKDSWNFIKDL